MRPLPALSPHPPAAAAGLPRRLAGLLLALASALAPARAAADAPSSPHALPEPGLLQELLGYASRFSGLEADLASPLPVLRPLPPHDLAATVCPDEPQHCRGLVAVYDTERRTILYRDTLDLRDPTDQSFIVHELVHHLQHQHQGDALFATCHSTLAGEVQAYHAQNLYQQHFRQWQRMGEMLRFAHCADAAAVEGPMVVPGGPAAAAVAPPR